MDNCRHIMVFITATDNEEASLIARVLLEQRKAACVNIINGISSVFRWQGQVTDETESLLIVKTTPALLDDIIEIVKEVHSYETPEIIALPVIGGSGEYLKWLDESVSTEDNPTV